MSQQQPTTAPVPTSLTHAVDVLIGMGEQDFFNIVDRDIRGDERLQPGELPLDPLYSEALRTPAVCDEWYQALARMKKSTEYTLAAKGQDDKRFRLQLEADGNFVGARELRGRHLKWRAGAVRFLTGVEARLMEANHERRKNFANALPSQITMERDRLSETVRELRSAISTHREDFLSHDGDEPSDADTLLWAMLDG